ncbi:putative ribulose-bisphosphate carboxylase [Helianthus anomalus]
MHIALLLIPLYIPSKQWTKQLISISNLYSKMASLSSSTMATGAIPTQATMVASFSGLRSTATFPTTKQAKNDFSTLPSNGGRVQCMKVWPPLGLKKYETLSYLPDLTEAQLAKEVDYLLRNKWVPCLEFELEHGFVYRENARSPGYYDGRYWTMWKLPMFGCTDSAQVLKELNECKKEYPNAWIRIIGFDNVRQVQCISFIASKPDGY